MNPHQATVISQFTRQAAPFSQSRGHAQEASLQLLLELTEAKSDDTVLDVACGTGHVACAFAGAVRHVTGIDLTPAMLEQAGLLAQKLGLSNLSWKDGQVEQLPFADASFSIVLSRYAFHHFLQPEVVLKEMARVCQPGGRVLVADACPTPEKAGAFNRFEKLFDPSHHRALTMGEFTELFTRVGLRNLRQTSYKMEMKLEEQLAAMFPNPGDEDELRHITREDIGVDCLGLEARLVGEEIQFAYPVTAFVADK